MTNKVVSLVDKKEDKLLTLKELLDEHIAKADKEVLDKKIDVLVLTGLANDGSIFYTLLEGYDSVKVIGLLDLIKNMFTLDSME